MDLDGNNEKPLQFDICECGWLTVVLGGDTHTQVLYDVSTTTT